MGNFFTLLQYPENVENVENVNDLTEDKQTLLKSEENTQLLTENIDTKDVIINGLEYELLKPEIKDAVEIETESESESDMLEENKDNTITNISDHISKKILKEIFEEIKKRNPIINEENELNETNQASNDIEVKNEAKNEVKTTVYTSNLETIVSTCINNDETTYILPKGDVIKTKIDNLGNVKTSHYKQSSKNKITNLPIFYPNITAVPYKFPPKPAPINVVKPFVVRNKPKFSFWGNAYMDTKRLIQKPKIQYIPSNLNNNFKLKKE